MPFKTLEEANAYELEMQEKYASLETAKQGLETKLADVEKTNEEYLKEVNRLKIKNYEYFEKLSVQNKGTNNTSTEDEDDDEPIKLDDVIKDF